MNIFDDYLSFKEDNLELIEFLIQNNSNIISRFKHVLAVVDYLHDQQSSIVKIEEDEEVIFTTGYEYIFRRFNFIQLVLEKVFNKDYIEMESFSKTINLLLYIHDFKEDIEVVDEGNTSFNKFEDSILKLLESKSNVEDAHFVMLDELSTKVFEDLKKDYYGINEIFYDIALEYALIDEDDVEINLGV